MAFLDSIEFNEAQLGLRDALLARHMSDTEAISLTRRWLQVGLDLGHSQVQPLRDIFLDRLPVDRWIGRACRQNVPAPGTAR